MKTKRMGWLSFYFEVAAAGLEAQKLITIHLSKLSCGSPAVSKEIDHMLSDKAKEIVEIGRAAAAVALSSEGSTLAGDALRAVHGPGWVDKKRLIAEALPRTESS